MVYLKEKINAAFQKGFHLVPKPVVHFTRLQFFLVNYWHKSLEKKQYKSKTKKYKIWNQLTQFGIPMKGFSTQIQEIRKDYQTQQLKIAWK